MKGRHGLPHRMCGAALRDCTNQRSLTIMSSAAWTRFF